MDHRKADPTFFKTLEQKGSADITWVPGSVGLDVPDGSDSSRISDRELGIVTLTNPCPTSLFFASAEALKPDARVEASEIARSKGDLPS